ncbi:hypothetical protein OG311_00215 [Streptomyces sp. NBC_01343]|uniref:hypothetical protein n=1 Tax=Streptomyces sp. NBC_01343 TaxID=2903832 RepID=UPI002E0EEF69|nr:hypothetical protein OG311_00215 [Streptomyces sp. NBC_01343]
MNQVGTRSEGTPDGHEDGSHLIEDADGESLAVAGWSVDGADVARTTRKHRETAAGLGLSSQLLDELADLAADRVRDGGLRLMGEGGCCPS